MRKKKTNNSYNPFAMESYTESQEAFDYKVKKEHLETSKVVLYFSLVFVTATWASNLVLAWFNKPMMSDVTIQSFLVFGGFVTGGYYALQGYRNGSINRVEREYVKVNPGNGRTFENGVWRDTINMTGSRGRNYDNIGD